MIDRIDQWLLTRFDLLVGWNRDRGAGDQWQMSRVAGEASIGLNVAGMILLVHIGNADGFSMFARGILLISVVAAVLAGRHSSYRYQSMVDGALRARTVERPVRRVQILLTGALAIFSIGGTDMDDIAVTLSLLMLDASIYLKAAVPPPPSIPPERKPTLART